ncbi:riboflavin synthase [Spirochaeta africana]|uniref:Riboflavin synthase n=1 Tax=Spirochaeta africana (strain ATCC 700263 / DSM 8902 / Z-7692) TaxID=889378 RepID=H9UIQ5_SPIAZ|nr:riboflavin synthase [Spirochaeta africana]AFG37398.1 riboflavin synthase, alpha subunit [Spirochaeta africana DSM 8902]
MFTGLIQEVGSVVRLYQQGEAARLEVACPGIRPTLQLGDSVAINGACQTVARLTGDGAEFDTLSETLAKTTLGSLRSGDPVNLETSLTPSTPMGGHFVQGHVNGTGRLSAIETHEQNVYLTVELPQHLLQLCVAEGSIAIDGISLTTASVNDTAVVINVIPHTMQHTTLGSRRAGDLVNIETDIIARYVQRLLGSRTEDGTGTRLTEKRLADLGYGDLS